MIGFEGTRKPAPDWEDAELVEACLQGNQDAWSALVEKYKRLVYSVPFKYRLSQEDAADVFQAVWIDLHAELGRLRETKALRSWLATVAAHKCFRLKGRQRRLAEEPQEDYEGRLSDDRATAPELLEEVEREQKMREAVKLLPERCQRIVQMLFYQQPPVPYEELAKQLGLAEGSIGFIRGRCLKKLRKTLEEMGF